MAEYLKILKICYILKEYIYQNIGKCELLKYTLQIDKYCNRSELKEALNVLFVKGIIMADWLHHFSYRKDKCSTLADTNTNSQFHHIGPQIWS